MAHIFKSCENTCHQRTFWNHHPSPCGEGYGDTLTGVRKRALSLKKSSSGVKERHHLQGFKKNGSWLPLPVWSSAFLFPGSDRRRVGGFALECRTQQPVPLQTLHQV